MADLTEQLSSIVLRLGRRLRQQTGGDLSAIDAALLGAIERHPELGLSELADREGISRPSMSVHLKRLTGTGLLDRTNDGVVDRRRIRFRLTSAGRTALARSGRRRAGWLHRRLDDVGTDDLAAIAGALNALTRVIGTDCSERT